MIAAGHINALAVGKPSIIHVAEIMPAGDNISTALVIVKAMGETSRFQRTEPGANLHRIRGDRAIAKSHFQTIRTRPRLGHDSLKVITAPIDLILTYSAAPGGQRSGLSLAVPLRQNERTPATGGES